VNRSDYLIFGTRMAREVVHYPDLGRVGSIGGEAWQVHRTDDGALIMEWKTEQVRPLTWCGSKASQVP
jgi:hypothetical protein